ncbi:hypothetical protein BDV32DRAFT_143911 [Aspergillus pseudonomiae]|uniref:Uncharacterized protein n=1 Tax=Aspergillus pseudonomiae TaxID=1506151 RepID=A0A5N6IJ35_9EURO|nr:uncharacterized protein BDV37DRAFT_278558 [Aspergillus pseudonomiae]KAB8266187.1 hypothetical protein BDV32DRAFT_143911 [Aspergillus pseudonomiae]KAE8409053.1 hypothetical protein BDV37DRAFT_278558 [Aspergillus pseudonomiae]
MSYPSSLPSLTTREAIADTLYRCVGGFDTADAALFDSAFTKDATFDLNGRVLEGLESIHKDCYDNISKLDTIHYMSNVRVNVKEGEEKGSLTASALAQHYRPGEGIQAGTKYFLAGSLYEMDVVRDEGDGLWKITHWKLKIVWAEGDWGVVLGE